MMKNILLLLAFAVISTPAFAIKDFNAFHGTWGGRPWRTCLTSGDNFPSGAWVGTSNDRHVAVNTGCRVGYGRKALIATEITDKGAKFCPIFVYAVADGWHDPTYTRYGRYGDDSDCVWLCLPGWTGETCEESTNGGTVSSSCNLSTLKKSNYNKYTNGASAEAESEIGGFVFSSNDYCGNNTTSETDMILAVTGFLKSGHGAYVQQVIVTAHRYFGWGHNGLSCDCDGDGKREKKRCEKHEMHLSVLNTESAGTGLGSKGILVCKNGYAPNAAGDDCVEINSAVCNVAKCEQVANGFNADIHQVIMYQEEKKNDKGETVVPASCIFKCAEPGYAFESETSKNCVECPRELRQGESAETGICLKCAENQIFDSVAGACVEGMQLQSTDLMYGSNKSSSATDESEPCWMKSKTEEYINCILSPQQ